MSARAQARKAAADHQRDWWLRALLVFQAPRAVFHAIRDESDEAAGARQEPITAIVFMAGIASVLQTSVAGSLLDDPALDAALVFVWAVIGGGIYGLASYWLGGAALYMGTRGASGKASYRRARHVLGFAAAPIALSLVLLWPIRLAIWGGDTFRSGGSDIGVGPRVFDGLSVVFVVWAFGLLLLGIRATYGWTWLRAVGTVLLAVMALLCVAALVFIA